ncbi:Ku protein [Bhargavaea cecembensis]|uniref:Non-homologous end joining protein Ku n=1 Tax=Bhargavaea cecembensis TaxID=394098 RepID=A0A165GRY0_9BACL|nr:Ku protein [Bhargavaea cecembensis]KZE37424.1 Ku protein [Bhargavaea cecembensis]
MHTVWKGSISFGLVNIPVKLHAATEDRDVKLRQLHKECNAPISYKKVCTSCNAEVKPEDIVKAYEYTKGKFVVLDEDDLKALKKENEDKAVEIVDFVKLEEIDPIYFERTYFLAPDKGGAKAYALLRAALGDSDKIGIAKIIIRQKEQLAAVRVYKNALMLETIHYPDEVRKVEDVPNVPEAESVVKKELDVAMMLIEQLTTPFEPEKYKDEYREALLELIEAKKAGKETVTATEREAPAATNATDLMAALQASLEKSTKKKPAPKKRAAAKKKKA